MAAISSEVKGAVGEVIGEAVGVGVGVGVVVEEKKLNKCGEGKRVENDEGDVVFTLAEPEIMAMAFPCLMPLNLTRDFFVDEKDVEDKDNECGICGKLLDEAVILNNGLDLSTHRKDPCNHVFDKACILKWIESKNTCPCCRQATIVDDVAPYMVARRRVAAIKVRCRYKHKGCSWTGPMGIRGANYAKHIYGCEHRGSKCPFCKYIVRWEHLYNHAALCPGMEKACLVGKGRCPVRLRDHDMSTHMFECEYRSIECPLSVMGCTWSGARCDLAEHESKASESHVVLLRTKVDCLEKKLKSTKSEAKKFQDKTKRKWISDIAVVKKHGIAEGEQNMKDKFGRAEGEVKFYDHIGPDSKALESPEGGVTINECGWEISIRGNDLSLTAYRNVTANVCVSFMERGGKKIAGTWEWRGKFIDSKPRIIRNALTPDIVAKAYNEIRREIDFVLVVESANGEDNVYNPEVMKRYRRSIDHISYS